MWLLKKGGPGGKAVHHEYADEKNGCAASGNAEGQCRDNGTRDAAVVRGVGGDKALVAALTELLRSLGHRAGQAVAGK